MDKHICNMIIQAKLNSCQSKRKENELLLYNILDKLLPKYSLCKIILNLKIFIGDDIIFLVTQI
jgi:hypothetical protein